MQNGPITLTPLYDTPLPVALLLPNTYTHGERWVG